MSKLADAILDLINSRPQSPSRAEIDALISWNPDLKADFLRAYCATVAKDSAPIRPGDVVGFRADGTVERLGVVYRPPGYLVSQEQLAKAVTVEGSEGDTWGSTVSGWDVREA